MPITMCATMTRNRFEDDLEEETESRAQEIVDLASAATTVDELQKEIESLEQLTHNG